MTGLKEFLPKLATGATLTETEAKAAFNVIMSGEATPAQIGAFLMALRVRGETVDEIAAAASIMRAKVTPVKAPDGAIDTCGTGGDARGTFNISTGAALVVAAAGVPVAKHGNKAMSSKSGSADVLSSLGVNLDADMSHVEAAISEAGIGFLMAPRHHSAMRHVGPVRTELGTRTIFNLLGPLANPAGAKRQVMGVFAKEWVEPLAIVLGRLGAVHALVVHGADGLDELTTTGVSHVAEYKDGKVSVYDVTPEDAGLPRAHMDDLRGGDAEENASVIRAMLDGAPGPYRDIVCLNAAAGLLVGGRCASLMEGAKIAAEVIDSGAAKAVLAKLVDITNRPTPETA